jgi:aryl-alcohol dehydrogenase-like predicted oxidoreductase
MRYVQFGQTGIFVSCLSIGAMTFGNAALGEGTSEDDALRIIGIGLDAGINVIDTADVYGAGRSEEIVGRGIKGRRDDVILSTKLHARTGSGPNAVGQSRVHLRRQVEESLRRLKTDYIDLYQVHQFDPVTRFEETLRTLDDLISQGKVRYIGCSNFRAWQIMKALMVSSIKGWEPFASVQAYYSLVGRDIEREIVPLLRDQGLALLTYSPLAGGFLAGKITRSTGPEKGTRRAFVDFPPVDRPRGYAVIEALQRTAAEIGATVPQVALAWQLHQPFVTSVILGCCRPEQLTENLAADSIVLPQTVLDEFDTISRLPLEYPEWATQLSKSRYPAAPSEGVQKQPR